MSREIIDRQRRKILGTSALSLSAAAMGIPAMTRTSAAVAADYRNNPFTLVYEGAITKNEPGKVNIHAVTYELNGLRIAANVYTPANYDRKKKHAAIVVAHPNGGVKEQTAGLHAQRLFRIDGATHIETYWVPEYVDATMRKLTAFYARTL